MQTLIRPGSSIVGLIACLLLTGGWANQAQAADRGPRPRQREVVAHRQRPTSPVINRGARAPRGRPEIVQRNRDHDRDRSAITFRIGSHESHGSQCTEGHYVVEHQQVLVQRGYYEKRFVPAVYETRYDPCGRPYRVLVREACHETVWVPDRYETRTVRRWVPASCRCGSRSGVGITIGGVIRF